MGDLGEWDGFWTGWTCQNTYDFIIDEMAEEECKAACEFLEPDCQYIEHIEWSPDDMQMQTNWCMLYETCDLQNFIVFDHYYTGYIHGFVSGPDRDRVVKLSLEKIELTNILSGAQAFYCFDDNKSTKCANDETGNTDTMTITLSSPAQISRFQIYGLLSRQDAYTSLIVRSGENDCGPLKLITDDLMINMSGDVTVLYSDCILTSDRPSSVVTLEGTFIAAWEVEVYGVPVPQPAPLPPVQVATESSMNIQHPADNIQEEVFGDLTHLKLVNELQQE